MKRGKETSAAHGRATKQRTAPSAGKLERDKVARRLALLRTMDKLTQVDLAAILHVPAPTWNTYERGNKLISVETAGAAAAHFKVTVSWIYFGDLRGLPAASLKAITLADPDSSLSADC